MSNARKKKKAGQQTAAKRANKYELYEESVQNTEHSVEFVDRIYRKANDRRPMVLREDFCGTAMLCADWVASHQARRAIGIDLDPEPLESGRERHLSRVGDAAKRVKLINGDVLEGCGEKVDAIVAHNFSYWVFHERADLKDYFRAACKGLAEGGTFLLDVYGGIEAQTEMEEDRDCEGFTYIWDQKSFDPITNNLKCAIHFRMNDGSMMRNAFTYDWRLWTLPELRDVLVDAGFSTVDTYWEGNDDVYRKVKRAENWQAWIAYLVAWK